MVLIDVAVPYLQALAQGLEPLMKASRGAAERDPLDYLFNSALVRLAAALLRLLLKGPPGALP